MKVPAIALICLAAFAASCTSTMNISDVSFAQPVEFAVKADAKGNVSHRSSGLAFNISEIEEAEPNKRPFSEQRLIRIIRDHNGYYFITSAGYQHVYVMQPVKQGLRLHRKIMVAEKGLRNPAFNQRKPFVELIDGVSGTYKLSIDGLDHTNSETTKGETAS